MTTSIFVTGATGFIAQHIIKELIRKGYKVVGTVRSDEKGQRLKKLLQSHNFHYEIVPDIKQQGAFDDALKKHKEVTVVLHTASPFHFDTTDPENDLLIPAINGTKGVLKAIKENAPQVERVVITSSYASTCSSPDELDNTHIVSESSWNDITWEEAIKDPVSGYRASKSFAEKAGWDFIEKEKPRFDFSVVNPGFVFGPQAFDADIKETLNTSAEIINALLKLGANDNIPLYKGCFIDVRDVALAHISAFEKEETKSQRLLLSNGRFTTQFLLDILNREFSSLRGQIPLGNVGSGSEIVLKLAKINNDKTRSILGFEFVDLNKTVKDSVQQVLNTRE